MERVQTGEEEARRPLIQSEAFGIYPCMHVYTIILFSYTETQIIILTCIFLTLIPLGGGGGILAPPVIFFAVHLDRLEFHVQTSWLFSLKSPAYFDI